MPSLHLSTTNGLSVCEVQLVQCDYQLHGTSTAAAVGSSHCMVHRIPLVLYCFLILLKLSCF